jgi:hypothetical protein
MGTNTHYCISVLYAVESLVRGITDLADDPSTTQPGA